MYFACCAALHRTSTEPEGCARLADGMDGTGLAITCATCRAMHTLAHAGAPALSRQRSAPSHTRSHTHTHTPCSVFWRPCSMPRIPLCALINAKVSPRRTACPCACPHSKLHRASHSVSATLPLLACLLAATAVAAVCHIAFGPWAPPTSAHFRRFFLFVLCLPLLRHCRRRACPRSPHPTPLQSTHAHSRSRLAGSRDGCLWRALPAGSAVAAAAASEAGDARRRRKVGKREARVEARERRQGRHHVDIVRVVGRRRSRRVHVHVLVAAAAAHALVAAVRAAEHIRGRQAAKGGGGRAVEGGAGGGGARRVAGVAEGVDRRPEGLEGHREGAARRPLAVGERAL